ncbi:hypothetical protein Scep_025907 [Stephania cephalantha]|uniref:GDT1 family protein n=1 Tax=Stephania cephalantha TaxID=152367 RepID=A0AAP0HMQ7_9MAGN
MIKFKVFYHWYQSINMGSKIDSRIDVLEEQMKQIPVVLQKIPALESAIGELCSEVQGLMHRIKSMYLAASKLFRLVGDPNLAFEHAMVVVTHFCAMDDSSTGFCSLLWLIFDSCVGCKWEFMKVLLKKYATGVILNVGREGRLRAMTVISVVLGRTFHYIDDLLPFRFGEMDLPIDDIAAVCLLVYFGLSTLIEASSSDGLKTEEEQKEAELAVSEFSGNGAGIVAAAGTVISTFLLVFVAEWGDKSFFSTIALAAASSPLGVIGGALAGHAFATLLAVLGGSLLGTFLSEKVIAYVGGSLFLVFAAVTLVEIIS